MTITPELLAFIINIMVVVGVAVKIERRFTKLETIQAMILDHFIDLGVVDRRKKAP